jgi:O-acetyl-ADP-ribose deacetylase (regulator of RNase III)
VDARIQIVEGDITRLAVDAIVNAANEGLTDGGGVNGAIHRAAGPGLDEECRRIGGCPTGEARITGGYDLRARWVIHTVGPVWQGGQRGEADLLASCYRSSLALASEHGVRTIAFPLLSTGVFGYPFEAAVRVALESIEESLRERRDSIERVVVVAFGSEAYERCLAISQTLGHQSKHP